MNKVRFIYILCILFGIVSCSKENDEEGDITKEDIIGTWTATSGQYDLSLEITSSGYDFKLTENGNGGVYDTGTYDISGSGKITFVNDYNTVLATGQLRNEKLSLTFVNTVAIMMLGIEASANVVFTPSGGSSGPGDNEDSGYMVIQNLSESNTIVKIELYDTSSNLLGTDAESLEADYQFTYDALVGSYIVKVTDNKGKSFTSKSFKIVKGKYTVLAYTGSALNILATGVSMSETFKAVNHKVPLKHSLR